jgi:hypothetical protein
MEYYPRMQVIMHLNLTNLLEQRENTLISPLKIFKMYSVLKIHLNC